MNLSKFLGSIKEVRNGQEKPSKPYDTGHAYRTSNWLTYYAVCMVIVLGCVCLGQTGAIISLLPLKTVQPYLVTFHNKSDQVVTIEPLNMSKKGNEPYISNMCREYVRLRETVDLLSELERYDHHMKLSDLDVWQEFKELYRQENAASPLEKFRKDNVTRSVLINNVTSLASSLPDVWQVTWTAIDQAGGKKIGEGIWVSTLKIGFKQDVLEEDLGVNPFGFEVRAYKVTRRN